MVWGQLSGRIPYAFRGDFEVLKRAGPGFHRIGGNPGVPVQFVHREISVFDRETDGRQLHVCHVGLGPELPSLPLQVHAARYGASERASKEIRNLETSVIHTIGAAAGQSAGVKNFVA